MSKVRLLKKSLFTLITSCLMLWHIQGKAYIEVKVSDINYNPLPIVQFSFVHDNKSKLIAEILNDVVTLDLRNSGEFAVYVESSTSELTPSSDLLTTNSLLDRYIDFNAVIIGKIIHNNGIYTVSYVVWDIYNSKPLLAKSFSLSNPTKQDITYLAHYISNSIYKVFIGEEGHFNSKIAFISNKKVYIMDYDGQNKEAITSGELEVYTPIFSYDNKYLAYIVLNHGISEIYIYDLCTKVSYKLGNFNSLALSPRFSRDGKFMLFALANKGSTNIYKLNLLNKEVTQLTYSDSINLPGDFSPNGEEILFMSDRRGKPQIYTMDSNGKHIKRISNFRDAYYTPKWSPRGDMIAFTKIAKGGKFNIGIMSNTGDNERIIGEEYLAEGPSWSSNGRSLVYQFVYDAYNKLYGLNLVNFANGYKILLRPFSNVKDPSFSNNFINLQIIENERDLAK